MTERLWEVPSSWEWTVVKELGDVKSGGTPSTKISEYWGGNIIWFAPSDLTGYKSKFIDRGAKTLTDEGLAKSSAKVMPAGSVMFSSRAPVGYVAINSQPSATNQGFKSVVPHSELFNEYLYYYLKAAKQMAETRATGTTFKELSSSAFGTLPIPIAPTNEQHRIVEKIEVLFEEIDRGVQSLRAAKNGIALYRQSLLKSAFDGRLTADWRAQNPDHLEGPDALLAHIREEREARYQAALEEWEQAVAEWRKGGKKGRKPTKPSRNTKLLPVAPDEAETLSQLPQGWIYTKLANLGDLGRGKSRHRPRNDKRLFGGPYPFIQTAEVKAAGRSITEYRMTYSEFGLAQSRVWPEGTLCITIAANIAETAFLTFDACFPDSVVGFTAVEDIVVPKFVELFLKRTRSHIESCAPATAQKNINLTTLETLVIPLCGPGEQNEIVEILDARLEAAEMLDMEIDANLARAEALRQSILKKAFAGHLVPQDPDDEHASAILERIQAGRARTPARRRRARVEA